MEEYVYFIRAVGTDFVKIGYTSTTVRGRMNTLSTSCPHELECLFLIPSENALETEREIHDRLREFQKKGEWYEIKADPLSGFLAVVYPQHVSSRQEIEAIVGEAGTAKTPEVSKPSPLYTSYYEDLNTPFPGHILPSRILKMTPDEIDAWWFQSKLHRIEQRIIGRRRQREKLERFLYNVFSWFFGWKRKLAQIGEIVKS